MRLINLFKANNLNLLSVKKDNKDINFNNIEEINIIEDSNLILSVYDLNYRVMKSYIKIRNKNIDILNIILNDECKEKFYNVYNTLFKNYKMRFFNIFDYISENLKDYYYVSYKFRSMSYMLKHTNILLKHNEKNIYIDFNIKYNFDDKKYFKKLNYYIEDCIQFHENLDMIIKLFDTLKIPFGIKIFKILELNKFLKIYESFDDEFFHYYNNINDKEFTEFVNKITSKIKLNETKSFKVNEITFRWNKDRFRWDRNGMEILIPCVMRNTLFNESIDLYKIGYAWLLKYNKLNNFNAFFDKILISTL